VLGLSDFQDFSTQLEQQLHNAVHGWVGGAMGSVPIAAFDPIFYAHHTMVDRIWRLWQQRHGQPGPPAGASATVLDPFPMTVGDVLDVAVLGYDYAGSAADTPGTG
jgi:tyrosinase